MAGIAPPEDSQLARSWNVPVTVKAIDRPLADVLDGLALTSAIVPEASQITPDTQGDPAHLVTLTAQGQPFKHVLGILLYQTRCRCQLDGETLVILPPE